MNSKALAGIVALTALAACARASEDTLTNARPLTTAEAGGVRAGDCAEARKRAQAKPDLAVDRIPAVVRQNPAPFQRIPTAVRTQLNQKGGVVKIDVVVDTLGRPVMNTFKVVESSPVWLAQNVKTVIPKWRFSAAELAGCKVARVFKFSATYPKRG
jgi:hypothetical protein